MSIASRIQSGALQVLQILGRPITGCRLVTSQYSPATGVIDGNYNNVYTGYGYPGSYSMQEANGQNVLDTDIRLTLYTTGTPEVDDRITIDAVVYRIMSVQKVSVEESTAVYRCQLRA